MLNKVIKKLQTTGKLPEKTSSKYNLKQGKPSLRGNSGFIAKKIALLEQKGSVVLEIGIPNPHRLH